MAVWNSLGLLPGRLHYTRCIQTAGEVVPKVKTPFLRCLISWTGQQRWPDCTAICGSKSVAPLLHFKYFTDGKGAIQNQNWLPKELENYKHFKTDAFC